MTMERESCRPIVILMVEDNPGDVRLTVEALKEGKVRNILHTVEDGEEAIKFLRRQETYAKAPRPDLVLLDLNLPKMNGREVLAEIKADPELRRIPVVILTVCPGRRTSRSAGTPSGFPRAAFRAPSSPSGAIQERTRLAARA